MANREINKNPFEWDKKQVQMNFKLKRINLQTFKKTNTRRIHCTITIPSTLYFQIDSNERFSFHFFMNECLDFINEIKYQPSIKILTMTLLVQRALPAPCYIQGFIDLPLRKPCRRNAALSELSAAFRIDAPNWTVRPVVSLSDIVFFTVLISIKL